MAKGIGIDGAGSEGSYEVDDDTKKMSIQHHIDTFNYNLRHAEDHLKKAMEACHVLENAGKAGEVDTPKSLLDLFKYFEETKDDENKPNAASMPLDDLKDKVKKASDY